MCGSSVLVGGDHARFRRRTATATSAFEGVQMVIPTLVIVISKKFFGSKKEDDEGTIGDHPVVRFLFDALITGNIDATDEMVDPDFRGYANGYPVFDPSDGQGPEQFNENIEYWRATTPDLSVDLYDELSEKGKDKTETVAIRFVFTGTITSAGVEEPFETEAAAFLTITKGKLIEWRIVVDEGFFRDLRTGMGLPSS